VAIDVLAGAPHYADHLAAVFGALPGRLRGSFMVASSQTAARVRSLGYEPVRQTQADRPVLVASYGDLVRSRGRRKVAIMEHGAGQSYGGRERSGRHGSYAGGLGRDASLFLHPGPHPAARDRAAYPDARVEVVGSPILDTLPGREGAPGAVVAVSFHFNATIAPESRTAFPWVWAALSELAGKVQLIGHAHPVHFQKMRRFYRMAGIEAVPEFSEVCRRADVYVCDNSSTIFAFAATGRPVVLLNPPWYDRNVDHGLRFWEASGVGVNCNNPADLLRCLSEALEDTSAARERRERALGLVYAYRSGAAARAAQALEEWAA
jgi:CDP-glycerol:poly(glycerophosphate) glycerophosphotransferase